MGTPKPGSMYDLAKKYFGMTDNEIFEADYTELLIKIERREREIERLELIDSTWKGM